MPTLSDSDQVIALERQWAHAMATGDLETLDAMVTRDFNLAIAAQGMPLQTTQREHWLSVMPAYKIHEMTLDDIHANIYGDIAVVTLLWTQKASVQGKDRSGTFFITDIWRKTDDGWKIAERHSSRPEPATAHRPT
jgi:ketosteroid isomerase-like protein